MAPTMSLLLPLDVDDPEFARGVEIGMVWTALGNDPSSQDFTMHAANIEMVLRIAEASGRKVCSTDLNDSWIVVEFAERKP